MARNARLLTAPGHAPVTVRQMADKLNVKGETVYRHVRQALPLGGVVWRWLTDEEMADLGEPIQTNMSTQAMRRAMECHCPECRGKVWHPSEIQKLDVALAGRPITTQTLPEVNRITGHSFQMHERYAPPGDWQKAEAPLPQPAPAEVAPPSAKPEWRFAWDSDLMPFNPWGPGAIR